MRGNEVFMHDWKSLTTNYYLYLMEFYSILPQIHMRIDVVSEMRLYARVVYLPIKWECAPKKNGIDRKYRHSGEDGKKNLRNGKM